MLASSAIIDINSRYNEAILCKQHGKTSCVVIGKLGKNRLVYLVTNESIELGVKDSTGLLSPLDTSAIELLKAGYTNRPKIISMIDIANSLNKHSKLKKEQ